MKAPHETYSKVCLIPSSTFTPSKFHLNELLCCRENEKCKGLKVIMIQWRMMEIEAGKRKKARGWRETMSNCSQNCWIDWNSAVLCFKRPFHIEI